MTRTSNGRDGVHRAPATGEFVASSTHDGQHKLAGRLCEG